MGLTRRDFLQSAGAALGALALPSVSSQHGAGSRPLGGTGICTTLPPRAAGAAQIELVAEVCSRRIRTTGPETEIWGFNGAVPGPLLRFRQGDAVNIHVRNALPQPTTVHWHGLRVPNAMDGVPYLTQPPIAPGAEFVYEFPLRDAGTYWYHPHLASYEQVARGLYGALIVCSFRQETFRERL